MGRLKLNARCAKTRCFASGNRLLPLAKTVRYIPLVLGLLAAGCNRNSSSPNITITHQFTPQPARVGPLHATFTLTDAASKPVTGAQVQLEADMAHPGMAPIFGKAEEVAPGQYEGKLNLTMGGDWVVLLHVKLADGQKLERQIELNGVEP